MKHLPGCLVCLLLASPTAVAKVTFDFTYFDVVAGTGVGFDDPTLGTEQRAAVETTAMMMGNRIAQTATVEIGVAPSDTDASGPIGIASANYLDFSPGIRDGEIYRRIVLGAADATPGDIDNLDGGMVFDFGYSVQLAGAPAAGVTYFPDVVRHELTHAMGYASFLTFEGTGLNDTSPADMYTRFDSMLTTDGGPNPGLAVINAAGEQLLDLDDYQFAYATGLVFEGIEARAANGDAPIKLFGSDPTHSALSSDVMFPSPATGFVRDDWSARDMGVLNDLGYVFVVPEPSGVVLCFVAAGWLRLVGRAPSQGTYVI